MSAEQAKGEVQEGPRRLSFGFFSPCFWAITLGLFCGSFALAQRPVAPYENKPQTPGSSERPADLDNVGITEKTGQQIRLDTRFKNQEGRDVTLRDLMVPGKPLMLSPVYFTCKTLCEHHLNGMLAGLQGLDWNLGEHFNAVAVSFDHRETVVQAKGKHEAFMRAYNRPGADKAWTFLTGDEVQIKRLMDDVGFSFKLNSETGEWAHASTAILINPEGKIMRYLPGIIFEPRDLKLAVTEAADGKVGTFVDKMVLFCFKYNPHLSRYTLYAFNLMKLGGALMVAIFMIWLIPFWLRNRRAVAS